MCPLPWNNSNPQSPESICSPSYLDTVLLSASGKLDYLSKLHNDVTLRTSSKPITAWPKIKKFCSQYKSFKTNCRLQQARQRSDLLKHREGCGKLCGTIVPGTIRLRSTLLSKACSHSSICLGKIFPSGSPQTDTTLWFTASILMWAVIK